MRRVVAVAGNTFREWVRNRILYSLLFFAVGLIGFAVLMGTLAIGEHTKIVRDVGLAGIHLVAVAIAVFVGVGLVFYEIKQRTVFTVLSKPIERWQFVAGKFLGLSALLLVELAILSAAYYAVLFATQARPNAVLLVALALVWIECVVVVGLALFFSTFTSPVLATFFTVGLWMIGHMADDLRVLAARSPSAAVRQGGALVSRAVPNLEFLNVKLEAVHGVHLETGRVLESAGYGLVWALVLVIAACAVFEHRDFE